MASLGGEQDILLNSQEAEIFKRGESRESSIERKVSRDRDEKLKLARERQNEERQRKIEELKSQAEAAQRYREQKEEERRRRIEEIRNRDCEKRQQVEERKRAILEAEKERREYILRKNLERDSKLETKKKDRNSLVFAFGSSTPRLLEPADFGTVSPSTFWGHRRSTSISNVAGATLSRRSSERELADSGAKKRATSASATERHDEDNIDGSHMTFRSVARRKTDLMPTIPNHPRDGQYGSRSSLSNTPRTPGRAFSMNRLDQLAQPIRRNGEHIRAILERERREQMDMQDETESLGGGRRSGGRGKKTGTGSNSASTTISRSMTHLAGTASSRAKYSLGGGISSNFRPLGNGNKDACKSSRSGNVTPGGSISTSRPGSAMSTSTTMSTSGYVPRRSGPGLRKPRPASIAGTVASLDEISKIRKDKPPMKTTTTTPSTSSAQTTPKRTSNIMSTSMIVTSSSRLYSAEKRTPAKREQPPTPKASTPKSLSKTSSSDRLNKLVGRERSRDVSGALSKSAIVTPPNAGSTVVLAEQKKTTQTPLKSKDEKNAINCVKTEDTSMGDTPSNPNSYEGKAISVGIANEEKVDLGSEKQSPVIEMTTTTTTATHSRNGSKENSEVRELTPPADGNDLMTASMIAKSKITTEEEAKAALAERRRLARVEAERQAELERHRIEEERLAELKMQEEEAERQRLFEEESIRMAFEQRKAEEERLRQAIEEAKQREDEERRRRDDEERQRLEREETEKRAKEEAEKQRLEVAERLKREEKEREERRKRVEAIMSRTRKGGNQTTPNSTPNKESSDTEKNTLLEGSQIQTQLEPTQQPQSETVASENSSASSSTESTTATTPTPNIAQAVVIVDAGKTQNTQAMYEQTVIDKESALINSFSSMIIDENAKNLQRQHQHHHQQQPKIVDVTNGKLLNDVDSDLLLQNSTETIITTAVANGNGRHVENINNKNERNILQDAVTADQLIDLSIQSQTGNNGVNFINNNNNNSLLTTTTTLVTADSHENKDISLL